MPIPEERLPQLDESDDETVEPAFVPGMLDETDELEFEYAESDDMDDELLVTDESTEPDKAGFGYDDRAE